MPTGDSFVNLVLKRFLSQSRMNGNFLEYLQEMFYDGISRIFPNHGLFTYPSGLTNNGDGTFTITADPLFGTDGDGHVLKLTGADRNTNIPFEDTAATYYWIGMHYIEVPSGVYINPRTGQVEYDLILEEIGELGNPTSASDAGGGTIKLVVDSILENGVDYSGREVRVWLTNPMSADVAVAFETLTVSYDGGSGENSVTTTTLLGQTSISVATADYQVAALGVSVKKSATNPWTAGSYCILGYLEGATPNETLIDSNDLSGGGGHTLQKAYDGAGGAGDGRNVTVANEAVDLDQLNLTWAAQDVYQSALRITKDGDRSLVTNDYPPPFDAKDSEGAIDVLQRMIAAYGFMHRVNLVDHSGSGNLLGSEAVNASGSVLTFTRGGVNLTSLGSGEITEYLDIVQVVNSSNGNDGIYRIIGGGSTTLSVENMVGSPTSFIAESGTSMEARIYRPLFQSNACYWYNAAFRSSLLLTNMNGFCINALGAGAHVPLHIVGADDSNFLTPMIFITDKSENIIYRIDYNGAVNMSGTLYMNNNDIDTEGGDVLSGTGIIDSEGGTIRSGGGVIDSEGGTIQSGTGIIDSEGGTIRSGGGVIDSEGGDIQANGGDITTTSFGIISSNHNVIADNDGNGIGDFKYGAPRVQLLSIPASEGMAETGLYWDFRASKITGVAAWTAVGIGTRQVVLFPVHLPYGSRIIRVRAKVYSTAAASINMALRRQNMNFGASTSAPVARALVAGATQTPSTLSSNYEVLSNTLSSPHTIDDGYNYEVVIDNTALNVVVYGVDIQYDFDTLLPVH